MFHVFRDQWVSFFNNCAMHMANIFRSSDIKIGCVLRKLIEMPVTKMKLILPYWPRDAWTESKTPRERFTRRTLCSKKGWCWYFMQAIFSWMNRICFCICKCALICKYAVEILWFHPLFTLIHWCTDSPRWSLELHMVPEFSGLQQAAWPLAETRSCGLTDCCKWLYMGRLCQPTGNETQSIAYNHLESSRLMFFFAYFQVWCIHKLHHAIPHYVPLAETKLIEMLD